MKQISLTETRKRLSKYLHIAADEEIVITRHGRPAGVLIGFESEEDWFDYRLENDPQFLVRIASARQSLQAGGGVRIEDLVMAE
ncbi:MAG: type II toxin-antitoxin system Phd/YefM family antitoxin [Caldilineales bacterium]|nr:type II toxin-antitoxin system Phd/YefM family antitoxin [Caldilineales bacterium]